MSLRWVFKTLLATLVLLMVAAIAADFGLRAWESYIAASNSYRQQQQQTKSETEKVAGEIADKCQVALGSNPTFRECLLEQIWTYQKQDNANQDLKAQQDMAYWAMMTAAIGGVSLIFGFGGLVGLLISLRHTREAITTDREIGERQVRAYLSIRPLDIGPIKVGIIPRASFVLTNSGSSPAYKVGYISMLKILRFPLPDHQGDLINAVEGAKHPDLTVPQGGTGRDCEASYIDDRKLTAEMLDEITKNDTNRLYLVGIVTYTDVFKRSHKTKFCAYIDGKDLIRYQEQRETVLMDLNGRRVQPAPIDWIFSHVHNEAD